MKVLLNCGLPFSLAHGGHAIQIQQTQLALQGLGVEVEPMRWWDETQTGDVIHYFCGRMPPDQIRWAHQKNIRVVMSELLTGQGSRSMNQIRLQKCFMRVADRLVPSSFTLSFRWGAYLLADAMVALTSWEKFLMEYMFGAAPERTHVVPNGVEPVFFESPVTPRGPWLVCTATITERKRVLELAQAAVLAQTPIWIIGRAYGDNDPYVQQFLKLAKENPRWIRFEGAIDDRVRLAAIYRESRGFVLLSTKESLSLSALEAAACGCPLLLSDLPWARSSFSSGTEFCPANGSRSQTAQILRRFYDAAPGLKPPPRPASWPDIGRQLVAIYEKILASPVRIHS